MRFLLFAFAILSSSASAAATGFRCDFGSLSDFDFEKAVLAAKFEGGLDAQKLRAFSKEVADVMMGDVKPTRARSRGNPFVYEQDGKYELSITSGHQTKSENEPDPRIFTFVENEVARHIEEKQGARGRSTLERAASEDKIVVVVHQRPQDLKRTLSQAPTGATKIFLVAEDDPLLSSKTGENSVQVFSRGQMPFPNRARVIDMHGGYVGGCMGQAMTDLAKNNSQPQLEIRVHRETSYFATRTQALEFLEIVSHFKDEGYKFESAPIQYPYRQVSEVVFKRLVPPQTVTVTMVSP